MGNVYLKAPTKENLHYRQKWLNDPDTMAYNRGYDVNIKGYDKNTGIIMKTDQELLDWYDNWVNKEPDKYFAYIFDDAISEPVGEIYYYLNDGIHSMGIVIYSVYRGYGYSYKALIELEKIAFVKNGINELSDIIPINRVSAIKAFKKAGFIQSDKEQIGRVFDKKEIARELIITREMYLNNN